MLEGFKWNGKGKEYNYRKELIFEVEYKKGLKWKGKGKEIKIKARNRTIFSIEYINGLKIYFEKKKYNKYKRLIYERGQFKEKKWKWK